MYNKAILIGRLTAEPELKQTPNGVHVTSFSIACNRRYSSKDDEKKAVFINIVTWRQQAEFICKYFHKGDPIGIEGSIQTRNYDDKNGVKHYVTEIIADSVFFVGSKNNKDDAVTDNTDVTSVQDFVEIGTDEDIPF